MPFTSYASVADVSMRHSIRFERGKILAPTRFELGEYFRSELKLTLDNVPFDVSEAAARETLIYPLLREVWKPFAKALTLWNNASLYFDDDLNGIPDFMVSRRSPLGPNIPDQPYMMVVEAKKDDFPRGWGRCLAALLAAQKLRGASELTYFGASTNGIAWQFGQLQGDEFLQDPRAFGLHELDGLAAAIHHLMIQCRDQAARLVVPA